MTALRVCISTFGLAAFSLAVAGVGVALLPSRCGEVGRPNVDGMTVAALTVATCLWLGGVFAGVAVGARDGTRFVLRALALLELGLGIAIFVYYRYQTAWYGHCG